LSFHRSWRRRPQHARPNSTRSHASPEQPRPAAPPLPPPLTSELAAAIAASPFSALGLSVPLVRAVLEEGYLEPSPVQSQVVPHGIEGRDVIACAQTGTGKTAAFVLPLLQRLGARGGGAIRGLILTPTRELASQIAERVSAYGRYLDVRHAVIYGGVSQHRQEIALRALPDIVVATPGRLLDLIQQKLVHLDGVTHFVLDEADRMLDMGFVRDVRRIVGMLPASRQTLFFSATMSSAIETLAKSMLIKPVHVSIAPLVTTAETVDQSVVFVAKADKRALLENVLRDTGIERALVFTRTKHGANRLSEQLDRARSARRRFTATRRRALESERSKGFAREPPVSSSPRTWRRAASTSTGSPSS
jgi:ATP-dependent RNA helicase RhlE